MSLEFFPPKETGLWPAFFEEVEKLKAVNPLFVSVTYGAGGGTQENTLKLVTSLKQDFGQEPMAHLTCVGASDNTLHQFLRSLTDAGINNVLALGGDPPANDESYIPASDKFKYASDLVEFIRANYPEIGIGVAGYPEKHIKAPSMEEDLRYLKNKLDLGGDFVITQLFFDNDLYYDFIKQAREIGIEKPIIPGVMPILNIKVIKRITSLCGATIPPALFADLESAQESGGSKAVEDIGVKFARKQAQNLLDNGAPGIHLYTLNKAEACLKILEGLEF